MVFYFAFGSNMRVGQMASRCHSSWYEGTARLPGWRWQINERGVANIVREPTSLVEGLVYSIDQSDKRALDRSEGVSRGFYKCETVELYLTRVRAVETQTLASNMHAFSSEDNEIGVFQIRAIVYVSDKTIDGYIREEYVERMQLAICDAQALGVDQRYLNGSIWPFIREPIMQPVGEKHVSQEPGLAYRTQGIMPLRPDRQVTPSASGLSKAEYLQRYSQSLEYATAYDARKKGERQKQAFEDIPSRSTERDEPDTVAFARQYGSTPLKDLYGSDIQSLSDEGLSAIERVPIAERNGERHRKAEEPESSSGSSGVDVSDGDRSEECLVVVSDTRILQQNL